MAFDSRTLEVIGTADTDEGVFHMWGSPLSGKLWVNCDISKTISVIDMWTLETAATVPLPADLAVLGGKPHDVIVSPAGFFAYVTQIDVAGAHGAGMRADGRYFFTTNLPGGGEDALWVIDTRSDTVVGDPVDAPYTVPHNIAMTPDGTKLYITHSGPNDTVSVFRSRRNWPTPSYRGEVTVGDNPFGIAFVK